MNPFHVIEDEEVAGLFEAEIARGDGCDYSLSPDLSVQHIIPPFFKAVIKCLSRASSSATSLD